MKRKITDEERKATRKARNARYQAGLKVRVSNKSLEGFRRKTKATEMEATE